MSELEVLQRALRRWAEAYMGTAWRETGHFIRQQGLSNAQFSLMMTMHYRGEAKITDIADMLGVSTAYASQMIDKMVQGGFLARAEDPTDRRVNLVNLSPSGRALTEAAIEMRSGWTEALAQAIRGAGAGHRPRRTSHRSPIARSTNPGGSADAPTG